MTQILEYIIGWLVLFQARKVTITMKIRPGPSSALEIQIQSIYVMTLYATGNSQHRSPSEVLHLHAHCYFATSGVQHDYKENFLESQNGLALFLFEPIMAAIHGYSHHWFGCFRWIGEIHRFWQVNFM